MLTTLTSPDTAQVMRRATRRIAPVWQLEDFVAVNPYLGLTELPFAQAAQRLSHVAGARSTLPAADYLAAIGHGSITSDDLAAALRASGRAGTVEDLLARIDRDRDTEGPAVRTVAEVAAQVTGTDWAGVMVDSVGAWASAHFDAGQAIWRSTDPDASPFASWRAEASADRTPEVLGLRGFRRRVRALDGDAVAATAAALAQLGVPDAGLELYLHALLLRLGGWSAHAARVVWDAELAGDSDDTAIELLAVLVCWEATLLASLGPQVADAWADARPTGAGAVDGGSVSDLLVLQEAMDRSVQRSLIRSLGHGDTAYAAPATGPAASGGRPRAQVVCCIDVRSEVLRRHLEAVAGDIETLGAAGFFGMPVEFRPLAHDRGVDQCPVLLRPGLVIAEGLDDRSAEAAAVGRRRRVHQIRRAWKSFKMGAISCFSFVGPVGLIYLPKLFSDGFGRTSPTPRAEVEGLPAGALARRRPLLDGERPGSGIPAEARVDLAEGILRSMSLTDGLAPVVVLMGHRASTVNNPYDSGLGCGACGGHSGEVNARVTAMLLNDAQVRVGLAERGITVPADTWFVPAVHDTTTDVVEWFDLGDVPPSHTTSVDALRDDLTRAGAGARAERAPRLGIGHGADVDEAVLARSRDWAQVRPEWGLAGCHSFVVAPRGRTSGVDLQGRSFLHSYDWRADEGFATLELIMTAPMVVASWISLQYYGSTVEPRLFGSGNKTLHNVVGKLGVLEGAGGDLRTGLPWQSVHDGTRRQHEPVRLNVVVEAPIEAMNDVISRHPGVRDLVDNGWVHLLSMDDDGRVAQRYVGALCWEAVDAPSHVEIREAVAA